MALTEEILERGREDFKKQWHEQHGNPYIHKCANGCGKIIDDWFLWCHRCGGSKNFTSGLK